MQCFFDPAGAVPLPHLLRDRLAGAGHRLDGAILHADAAAARLCGALGVPAFEAEGRIMAHPALLAAGPTDAAQHILLHEAAHVLQHRLAGARRPAPPDPDAEAEAEGFARALMAGAAAPPIRPRAWLPSLQPVAPLLLILAAAAVGAGLTYYGYRKEMEDRAGAGKPPRTDAQKHTYETAWGFVPFVGSIDQVLNGENWAQQAGGAVFLALDLTLVGGIAVKLASRSALKGGLLFMMRTEVSEGMALAARGGGTAEQKAAYAALQKAAEQGEIRFGKTAAEAMEKEIAQSGKTFVIAGSQGLQNHTVTLLVTSDGRIFKLHGGIFRLAYGVESRALTADAARKTGLKVAKDGWLRRFNRFTVYSAEGVLSDEALKAQIEWWGRWNSGVGMQTANHLLAPGCAGSQAILLERLGLPYGQGMGRYIPYFLDRARVAGGLGANYVVRPWVGQAANALHLGLIPTAGLGLYGVGRGPIMGPIAEMSFSANTQRSMGEAVLIEEATALDLSGANDPEMFDVVWPGNLTFANADLDAMLMTTTGPTIRAPAPKPAMTPAPDPKKKMMDDFMRRAGFGRRGIIAPPPIEPGGSIRSLPDGGYIIDDPAPAPAEQWGWDPQTQTFGPLPRR